MGSTNTSDRIRGKTLRWTFTEGPQDGKTYEHTFHQDGTVSYHAVEAGAKERTDGAKGGGERPHYAAYDVTRDVVLVSYLADSGFTLTVALNFADHLLVSIASNDKQWFPARGRFEAAGAHSQRAAA